MPKSLKIKERYPDVEQKYVDAFAQEPKLLQAWNYNFGFAPLVFQCANWVAGWPELCTSSQCTTLWETRVHSQGCRAEPRGL